MTNTSAPAEQGDTDKIAYAAEDPDVSILIEEFKKCSPLSGANWDRRSDADDVRYCRWPDQQADGKKKDTANSKAFPFVGASDIRVPLADEIIAEMVDIETSAFSRAWLPNKLGLKEESRYAIKLADHFINTVMADELPRQVELASQYRHHYGWCVLHPSWKFEVSLERSTWTIDAMQAVDDQLRPDLQLDPPLAPFTDLVLNPDTQDLAEERFRKIYEIVVRTKLGPLVEMEVPTLKSASVRRILRDFAKGTEAEIPMPVLTKNQPCIVALKPWDEVFVPTDCTDIQQARVIFMRCWKSTTQILEKELTEGWSHEWVVEALKHKGRISNESIATVETSFQTSLSEAMTGTSSATTTEVSLPHQMIEVLYAVYRSVDDDGVPGIYYAAFHPEVRQNSAGKNLFAKVELLSSARGAVPFIFSAREYHQPRLTSSRGVPELCKAYQRVQKTQIDGVVDFTSVGVFPPINVYKGPVSTTLKFGPGARNEVVTGKEPKFMAVPSNGVPMAFECLQYIEARVDNYFGRMAQDTPPAKSQIKMQRMITHYLIAWKSAIGMLVDMAQDYLEDAEFAEITGAPLGWLESRRGQVKLPAASLRFDVRELDPEFVMQQLEAFNTQVIPADVNGTIERSQWTKLQARILNPFIADQIVQDAGPASDQLYNKVSDDMAKMFLGNATKPVEMDPAAQTKLDTADQILKGNPTYQAGLKNNPVFAQRLQEYVKNLQFSVSQQQNKQIGRVGVKPPDAGGGPAGPGTPGGPGSGGPNLSVMPPPGGGGGGAGGGGY